MGVDRIGARYPAFREYQVQFTSLLEMVLWICMSAGVLGSTILALEGSR